MKIYTVNDYVRDTFGEKLYKISINAGTTCPNRDGTAGVGGCIFCSAKGSGDFSECADMNIYEQIEAGKKRIENKTDCRHFIAYFQSFTNTYGDLDELKRKFYLAINHPDISVLSIATRPDCLSEPVLSLLSELNEVKPVWIELGLQTMHDHTAKLINRCYELFVYDEAVAKLKNRNIHVITHMILGLPGETVQDMIDTASYIGRSGVNGIKFQLLHVLKDTPLAALYEKNEYVPMTMEAYVDALILCLQVVPDKMVIHRMTGDGPKNILIAPLWSGDKKRVLNYINQRLAEVK